jgi:general secretion pathway protein D
MKLRFSAYLLCLGFCILCGFQASSQSPVIKSAQPLSAELDISNSHASEFDQSQFDAIMEKFISIHAKNHSLAAIMDRLGTLIRVSIVFDPIGLDDAGVSRDQTVSLNVHNVRIRSALKLLLEPLGLTLILKDEVLQVTSVERASDHIITKVYDCTDLVIFESTELNALINNHSFLQQELSGTQKIHSKSLEMVVAELEKRINYLANKKTVIYDFDSLIEIITSSVTPDSWIDNGGKATIQGFQRPNYQKGFLIISQTAEYHNGVEQLLNQIREHLPQQEPAEENK